MNKFTLFLILPLLTVLSLYAQVPIEDLEFRNKPLPDVLIALGAIAGYSMLPDETVDGNITYRFSNTTFNEALEILGIRYGLFFEETAEKVLAISRMKVSYNKQEGLLAIQAKNVEVFHILQTASRVIGRTILFDPLPREKLTLNSEGISPRTFLSMILSRFPDYTLVEDPNYFFIKRSITQGNQGRPGEETAGNVIKKNGEEDYSITLEKGDLITTLEELFTKGEREYALLFKSDATLQNLNYRNKGFEELLKLLLVQTGGDFTVSRNIYYIFNINRQDVLKQYKLAEYLPLKHLSAGDIPALMPNILSASSFYKVDKKRNGLILSGSLEEIQPIKDYILSIDRPMEGRRYYTFRLDYVTTSEAINALPSRLRAPEPVELRASKAFLGLYTEEQKREVEELLSAIDQPEDTHILTFRYLKAEDFLTNLPLPYKAEDFANTGSTSSVYFKGSREKLEMVRRIVEVLDVPQSQIRYKLLIIQYQEGQGVNYSLDVSNELENTDSKDAYVGNIGKLFSLKFDILSTFGYVFSVDLETSISNNTAKVLADTTLHGLSGETIKFQNSSTYRYQEQKVDEDGKVQPSGVTKEISTGLFMDITGWISGDNMITMKISSTLSKKGVSSNSSATSLPPTSERVINTHIRTPSGKPIIIGGLMQTETNVQHEKVPLLGYIPLLGNLFSKYVVTEENTELVIYIVPYLDMAEPDGLAPTDEIDRLFEKFFPSSGGTFS